MVFYINFAPGAKNGRYHCGPKKLPPVHEHKILRRYPKGYRAARSRALCQQSDLRWTNGEFHKLNN